MSLDPSIPQRTCNRCQQTFPLTPEYWHRDKKAKHGFSYCCKECAKAKSRQWCADNPERSKENSRRTYYEHPEIRQHYAETHREEQARWHREWRQANPEKVREQRNRSEKKNRASANIRARRYIQRNPEKVNLRVHQRIALRNSKPFDFTAQDWQYALDYFGGCCAICGRPAGLWHVLAKEHWIPISDSRPDNPGTVPWNILPMCHVVKDGEGGCNNSKSSHDPIEWLTERYGKRKAKEIVDRIEAFFRRVRR